MATARRIAGGAGAAVGGGGGCGFCQDFAVSKVSLCLKKGDEAGEAVPAVLWQHSPY